MRKNLGHMEGEIISVTGCFERYGVKEGDGARWSTAVLTDITYNGKKISDHLWFVMKKDWLRTALVSGTVVNVTGKVEKYTRSNGTYDFGLVDTKNLSVVKAGDGKLKPAKIWHSKDYIYFKFLTTFGPRWYRKKKGKIERVVFKHNGSGFDESVLPMDESDAAITCLI